MKKLITITLVFFSVLCFAQIGDKAIQLDIPNTAGKADIEQVISKLKENNIGLDVSKVRRSKGNIRKIHLKMTTAKGVVEGTYTDFDKIVIYRTQDGQFGITPLKDRG